ncbi:hypothetical protein QZH41_019150 [Actinostola sp. cb2023]|nr:hypothetical protein QZH41_019150 [Actinostola sp. cb2023]
MVQVACQREIDARPKLKVLKTTARELSFIIPVVRLPLLLGVQTTTRPYLLVTQFHGNGNVSHTIASAIKNSLLKSASAWYIFMENLVKAVSFVHSKRWLHNDIKHNNVVCHFARDDWQPVLIDFGKSCEISEAKASLKKRDRKDYPWIAPEVLSGKGKVSVGSDVFSVGFLMKYIASNVSQCKTTRLTDVYGKCLDEFPKDRPSTQWIVKELVIMR